MHSHPVLLIVVPLLGGALGGVAKASGAVRLGKISAVSSAVACLVMLVAAHGGVAGSAAVLRSIGGWPATVGISLCLDGIGWAASLIAAGVVLAGLLFAVSGNDYPPLFYTVMPVLLSAMIGIVLTRDVFNLFVFLEILAVATALLIACSGERDAVFAAFRYLLLSSAAMAFYLVGVYLLYQGTGALSYEALARYLADTSRGATPALALIFIAGGLLLRVAVMPLHLWLPGAYTHAPHAVSMVLAGALSKMSLIALWRIVDTAAFPWAGTALLWIGALSALAAVVLALAESDVKRLLAYHSISQVGYIVAAVGAGSAASMQAALYYTMNHALFKSLLFLTMALVIQATGRRAIAALGGLRSSMPVTALLFSIGACSIMGLPPFNGYVGKKLLLEAVGSWSVVQALLWLTGVGTCASFLKLSAVFRGAAPHDTEPPFASQPRYGRRIFVAPVVLGLLCLATGLMPAFWQGHIGLLLAGASAQSASRAVYSLAGVSDSALSLLLGLLLYRGVRSRAGQRACRAVALLRVGMDGALLTLLGGITVCAAVAWALLH